MLRIPEDLRRFCDGQMEVTHRGTTIGAALENFCREYPDVRDRLFDEQGAVYSHLLIILNDQLLDRSAALEVSVAEEDTIEIYVAASGG